MKPSKVKPGDELYVWSSWSIDHGETDVDGGSAIVAQVHGLRRSQQLAKSSNASTLDGLIRRPGPQLQSHHHIGAAGKIT